MLKNIFWYSICVLVLYSCSSTNEVVYLKNTLSDEHKVKFDESPNPFSICLIFENSMVGDRILVEDFTSKKVLFNNTIVNSSSLNVAKIIFPKNTHSLDLFINDKLYSINSNTYIDYRFLVIKKIKHNKYNLTYTNQVSYW